MPDDVLRIAEELSVMLAARGIESVLIGAAAMAVHGYPRSTVDVDLGTAVEPTPKLSWFAKELRERGYQAELLLPEPEDPLGGVIRVTLGEDSSLDIVNFTNPWHAGAEQILQDAIVKAPPAQEGSGLRVIPLAHLIALKLYAGGPKATADVVELLRANPGLERKKLRDFLAAHGLAARLDQLPQE